MIRHPIIPNRDQIPQQFHTFLDGTTCFDSSSSPTARVIFLDKGPGFYLKTAPKGSLAKEASLTRYFHSRSLGAEVLAYESLDADWLLTLRVPGEDCTLQMYRDDPVRLCDTTAELLRRLHDTDHSGCPISDRTADYLATARKNHDIGHFDLTLFNQDWNSPSAEDAWKVAEANGKYLASDTLLHGDYCLPNIMLDNWRFTGFIDLDSGGVGDRHVDLFWGTWSLQYNLKTDRYRDRFLDAYGRDKLNTDIFPIIAAIEVFI